MGTPGTVEKPFRPGAILPCNTRSVTDGVFDERIAPGYDVSCPDMFAESVLGPTVDLLAEFAGGGRALEFAIGTGRVGLALSKRGVDVVGIELSQPMVDQLTAKPGAEAIAVTIGDMATTTVAGAGTFGLVYLVYNTITNLLTQDEQVACFANAAAHLAPGGRFLIEVAVPSVRRFPPGETFALFDISDGHVGVDEYDHAAQRTVSHHFWVRNGRGFTFDSPHRYVWPSELDLMARLAGMTLAERWSDWNRNPFTSESTSHVSVWEKPHSLQHNST
jgi:SAM-dependent methyltransferase